MKPWQLLDSATVPGDGGELRLYRRDDEFSIRADRIELMNSRQHGSEESLAELSCAKIAHRARARVLIGGLGMGFTVAAALKHLGADSQLVVAELVPAVVKWNRGPLALLAGSPIENQRVTVREVDVAQILKAERKAFDAILLDVDNGPEGLTRNKNNWLYSREGLATAYASLKPASVLGVWSVAANAAFARRLGEAGFQVEESRVRSRGTQRGSQHTIWIAQRGP